jgi:lipopolysaccharide biosynthesis protein
VLKTYVKTNINFLQANGFDVVLALTFHRNSDYRQFADAMDLPKTRVIIRKNFGKDFGAFKDVSLALGSVLREKDVLLLANDSLIGPLYPSDFLRQMEESAGDVVGVTESFDKAYHLQSSFIIIKSKKALNSYYDFINRYRVYSTRAFIVLLGEVGMTQHFLRNGLSISVYYETEYLLRLSDRKIAFYRGLNCQHAFMDDLFIKHNFPYLKRDAYLNNPNRYAYNYKEIYEGMSDQARSSLREAISDV